MIATAASIIVKMEPSKRVALRRAGDIKPAGGNPEGSSGPKEAKNSPSSGKSVNNAE